MPEWYLEDKENIRDEFLIPKGTPYVEKYLSQATASNITTVLNSTGVGLVNYRGHGATFNWHHLGGSEIMSTTYLHNLNNSARYPIVLNVTCNNGKIADPVESMVEAWTNTTNKGGVVALGATRSTPTSTNSDFDVDLFDYFYSGVAYDAMYHPIGRGLMVAHNNLVQIGSYAALRVARANLLLGCPELTIYRKDWGNLLVTHPAKILMAAPTQITVHVERWEYPSWMYVRCAHVCLYKPDEEIYERILTDNGGNATVTITPQYIGDLYITVTYSNCYPYEGVCRVSDKIVEPPSLGEKNLALRLDLTSIELEEDGIMVTYTTGRDDRYIEMTVYDILGRAVATLAQGISVPGAHQVMWHKKDLNTRTIPAGLYFCELKSRKTQLRCVEKFVIP